MNKELSDYLNKKKQFEADGFSFCFIFEMLYFRELKEKYGKKMVKLESLLEPSDDEDAMSPKEMGTFLKKSFNRQPTTNVSGVHVIHPALKDGFCTGKIILIEEERKDSYRTNISKRFKDAFEKIVANEQMIPRKSCIILSRQFHHQIHAENVLNNSRNIIKRENKRVVQLSKTKGQKLMTNFFPSTKSSSMKVPYIKPEPEPDYQVEKITRLRRGENVKILWLPKDHYELDPSQYVLVFLRNEVSRRLEKFQEQQSESNDEKTTEMEQLKLVCSDAMDKLPNEVWFDAVRYAATHEETLRKDIENMVPFKQEAVLDNSRSSTNDKVILNPEDENNKAEERGV